MSKIIRKQSQQFAYLNYKVFKSGLHLKSIGLLLYLMSRPKDWEYSINGLAADLPDGVEAIKTGIKELEEKKYLVRVQSRENGKFGNSDWIVSDIPITENTMPEKPIAENTVTEKTSQLNMDLLNIDKPNIDLINKDYVETSVSNNHEPVIPEIVSSSVSKKFIKPTIQEVREYCNSRNNTVDAEKFYDYYESNGWKVGKNKMKDWRAAVRTWERNSATKERNNPKDRTNWAF